MEQFSRKEMWQIRLFREVTVCTLIYRLDDNLLCQGGMVICGFTSPHLVTMEADSSHRNDFAEYSIRPERYTMKTVQW